MEISWQLGGSFRLPFMGILVFGLFFAGAPAPAADRQSKSLCNQFWSESNRFYKGMSKREANAAQLAACTAIVEAQSQATTNRALAFFNRGKIYAELGSDNRRKGDVEQAITDFSSVIALDPNDYDAYEARASAYRSLNRYVLVIADQTEAIRLKPTDINYSSRALSYQRIGNYVRALEDATQAIRLSSKPLRADNSKSRAGIYMEMGDFENALKDYTDAIKYDPKDYSNYYPRGDLYLKHGDFDRAMQDYNQAIRIQPKYGLPYYSRGDAYFAISDYDRAVADYDRAIRLDPKYAFFYRRRADAFLAKNDRARAIADYDQAVLLDDDKSFAYFARGIAYFYLGEFPRALIDFQAAYDSTGDLTSTIRLDYALWVEIARRRIGQPSRLAQMAAEAGTKEWPEPIARMLLGEITYEKTAAVANDTNVSDQNDRMCTTKLFWGERLLFEGAKGEAILLFRDVLNKCKRSTYQSLAAKAELKSLDVTP